MDPATFVKKKLKAYGIKLLFLSILIINSNLIYAAIIINEIMYDPAGSDKGHEWIEIYNNGSSNVNLLSWKLYEEGTNHVLTLINGSLTLNSHDYAIIVDEYNTFFLDYPNFNGNLLDSSWTSLNNNGEYITIKDSSSNTIDSVNYSTLLANGNGKSLERFEYGWNESNVIGGSPGRQNNATIAQQPKNKGLKLTVYLEDIVYAGTTYTSMFKIENLDHVSGVTDNINLTITYNITQEDRLVKEEAIFIEGLNSYKTSDTGFFAPTNQGNYTITGSIIRSTTQDTNKGDDYDSKTITVIDTSNIPCNMTINIASDKFIYEEGESIIFYNQLNNETFPFVIEYWIDDFFGNYYKNKYNATNTNQKSWKTEIEEQDRVLFIKSVLYPVCNDSDKTDNYAEKMFIVKSNSSNFGNAQTTEESSLEITDVDEKANFGDSVDVKVKIYKGNTNKYSIKLYAEDNNKKASEITSITLPEKYSYYIGELPIQLKPNCDLKLENRDYDIILEGLDKTDKEKIGIEGIKSSLCKTSTAQTTSTSQTQKDFEYTLLGAPQEIYPGKEFDVELELTNNDDQESEVYVWSYVYRGSKCYSGDRESNKKHMTLEKSSSKKVVLANKVSDIESGDYKLKIMINKDNQKTTKEITEDIYVEEGNTETEETTAQTESSNKNRAINLAEYNIINQLLCTDSIHYKKTIYDSKNEKIKRLIPIFIFIAMLLLSLTFLFNNQPKSF